MASLVVSLLGPDRPGLVNAVSEQARAHGANWTDSVMANFGGQFAGIVHLEVAASEAEALLVALRGLESRGLQVLVSRAGGAAAPKAQRSVALDLVGHDRPGIIQSISGELARHGVSSDKLQTRIASGAMSGEPMFHMQAQLSIPAGLDADTLRAGLENLANELMVDLSFGPDA